MQGNVHLKLDKASSIIHVWVLININEYPAYCKSYIELAFSYDTFTSCNEILKNNTKLQLMVKSSFFC